MSKQQKKHDQQGICLLPCSLNSLTWKWPGRNGFSQLSLFCQISRPSIVVYMRMLHIQRVGKDKKRDHVNMSKLYFSYICLYTYIYIFECGSFQLDPWIEVIVQTHIYIYMYRNVSYRCTQIHTYMHACMCVYVCIKGYTHERTHKHIYNIINRYLYICMQRYTNPYIHLSLYIEREREGDRNRYVHVHSMC